MAMPFQAVILATGINTDGGQEDEHHDPQRRRASGTLEGGPRQIRASADEVDYVEAHGTGTAIGDPIEAAAIGEVYGRHAGRCPASPHRIGQDQPRTSRIRIRHGGANQNDPGSEDRALPPSLHWTTPNPHIDFAGLNLEVVTRQPSLGEAGP